MFQDSKNYFFRNARKSWLTLLMLMLAGANLQGQVGLPEIDNYAPTLFAEHGLIAGPQIYQVTRDGKGRLILASRDGVVVYDGTQYAKVPDTRRMEISKIVADSTGKIYMGGQNDLGYLADDSLGQATFHSLADGLADSLQGKFRIYQVIDFAGSIFYMASDFVAVWRHSKLLTVAARSKNYRLMPTERELFLYDRREGLLQWQGTGFEKVEGGAAWTGILPKGMVRLDEGETGEPAWLVISRKNGLYRFTEGDLQAFPSEANAVLQTVTSYNIAALPQGEIAVATFGAGLLVMDQTGKLLQQIDEAKGLASNIVVNLTPDKSGNLWLGMSEGFARVGYPSNWSLLDKRLGLEAIVLDVQTWEGRLYVGTINGLYSLELQAGSREAGQFLKVAGIDFSVHGVLPGKNGMLLATGEGIFWGNGNEFRQVKAGIYRSLVQRNRQAEMAFVGGRSKITQVKGPEIINEIACPGFIVSSLWEAENGDLWAADDGILRIRPMRNDSFQVELLDSMGNWQAKMEQAGIAVIENKPVFYTWTGCWYGSGSKLLPVREYGGYLEKGNISLLAELGKDSLFLAKDGAAGLLNKVGQEWIWDTIPFAGLPSTNLRVVRKIGNTVWLGTDAGLFRYALPGQGPSAPPFQVLLKTVAADQQPPLRLDRDGIRLPAAANSLQFAYSATEFERPADVRFRHRMRGYRAGWSPWTTRKFAEFTNLPGGDYVFEVQGRNSFGVESKVVQFAFHLATPWFRQWWAYGLYALLGLLLVAAIVRLRTQQLLRAKARLEGIVRERTREIAAQKAQILVEKQETEKQRDRAEESERVKKRFFANMTHELRTPLTLILGPLAQLKSDPRHAPGEPKLTLIERNGKRLLRLINQLLDISRIESERMELQPIRRDIVSFVRQAHSNFEAVAAEKGLQLQFEAGPDSLEMDFDPEKLEKILFNLLSNAVKFTAQGSIRVVLEKRDTAFRLSVQDTGKGIAEADQPHVFDRFYQSENGSGKAGTGIGMALTKELVELHGGQIGLRSSLGSGTEFWLELPLVQAAPLREATEMAEQADLYLVDDPHVPAQKNLPGEVEATAADARDLVLVVEDNADVRAYIVSCIPPEYRVMEAEDGAQGLEMATRWVPDLVISDVMMPKMDGYELTAALKKAEASSHVPVILLTSRAEAESRLMGLETGADAYLTKPFDPAELQLRIRNLIAVRATLREKFRGEVLLKPGKVEATSTEAIFLVKVKDLIADRHGDEQLQVEDMARAVSLSKVQFSRKFKALTGTTPNKFLRKYRLDIARQLIAQKAGSMSEIGFQVGFSSAAYFSKCFMDEFGVSPSDYGENG